MTGYDSKPISRGNIDPSLLGPPELELEILGLDQAQELLDIIRLPLGWDGGHAPTPSSIAVDIASRCVEEAYATTLANCRITADIEGGVAVYFFGGGKALDGGWNHQGGILISNNGETSLYLRDRANKGAEISDVDPTEEGIRLAVLDIKKFISIHEERAGSVDQTDIEKEAGDWYLTQDHTYNPHLSKSERFVHGLLHRCAELRDECEDTKRLLENITVSRKNSDDHIDDLLAQIAKITTQP